MATQQELLNQASEIRDAELEGENTAVRVGTMLIDIIEYLGQFMTSTQLETALQDVSEGLEEWLEGYARIDSNSGLLDYNHSWFVPLSTMGTAFDESPEEYTPAVGELYYKNQSGYQIFVKTSSGGTGYPAKVGVVYFNKRTGKSYKWNGSAMVELGTDVVNPHIIDYYSAPAFADIAVGQSYFYTPQGGVSRLAVKTGSNSTYAFDPDPDCIYCFKDTGKTMIWKSGSRSWQQVGGSDITIANDLTTGGPEIALSAEMGVLIKQNVNAVQANIIRLYNKLANMAFLNAEDKAAAAPQELNWQVPKKTLTIANNIEHAVVMYNGAPVSSVSVDAGDTISLIVQGTTGWAVSSLTASGATVIDNQDGTFTVRVKVNNDMTLSISGTTVVVVVVGITTSNAAGALGLSNTSAQQGGTFVGDIIFVDNYYNQFEISSVKDANNNDVSYTLDGNEITIANVQSNITITAVAKKQVQVWFGKSLDFYGNPVSDSDACYTDFIKMDGLSASATMDWVYKLTAPVTTTGWTKRNLVFYDADRKLMFYDASFTVRRHPVEFSANANNSRTLTTANLDTIFNAAGAKVPVYCRASFAKTGAAITSGCGLTQGGTSFIDITDIVAATVDETTHSVTMNLTHCTSPASDYLTQILDGQRLEVVFKAASGYTTGNIAFSVTMGGVDITANTTASTVTIGNDTFRKLVIENVTGALVINASV